MAEIYSNFSNRAYVYEYKYRTPASLIDEVYGTAVHAEELAMTFGIPLNDQVICLLKQLQIKSGQIMG